jgi:hypothetical protein
MATATINPTANLSSAGYQAKIAQIEKSNAEADKVIAELEAVIVTAKKAKEEAAVHTDSKAVLSADDRIRATTAMIEVKRKAKAAVQAELDVLYPRMRQAAESELQASRIERVKRLRNEGNAVVKRMNARIRQLITEDGVDLLHILDELAAAELASAGAQATGRDLWIQILDENGNVAVERELLHDAEHWKDRPSPWTIVPHVVIPIRLFRPPKKP